MGKKMNDLDNEYLFYINDMICKIEYSQCDLYKKYEASKQISKEIENLIKIKGY